MRRAAVAADHGRALVRTGSSRAPATPRPSRAPLLPICHAPITVGLPGREPGNGEVVRRRDDDRVDAALIRIRRSDSRHPGSSTRFGALMTAEPNQPVEAIGFPRQQKFESIRDQEHLTGDLSPMTGALSRRYELTSTTPLPQAPDGPTPWAGMSGAAVFGNGLLVGVIRQDRRARFGTRLTATPATELLADPGFRAVLLESGTADPVCEPVELAELLESPYRSTDLRSVASLLRADAETVRFHGREPELERLRTWCETPERLAVMMVTGQGGQGKSRLARELIARMRHGGWATGLLRTAMIDRPEDPRFTALSRVQQPLLIAVDYAEQYPRQVRAVLRQAKTTSQPVRVLLLARERGEWAETLNEPDADVRDLLADAPVMELDPLTSTPHGWETAFDRAVRDLATALPAIHGDEDEDWRTAAADVSPPPDATHLRERSALGIQMSALTALLQRAVPVEAPAGEPLERTLLRHEESYWTRNAHAVGLGGLSRSLLRRAVAALRLQTVADLDQAIRFANAVGVEDTGQARIAVRWLRELYPIQSGSYFGLVQPDRLAEFLFVEACEDDRDFVARLVAVAAECGSDEIRTAVEARTGPGTAEDFNQVLAFRELVRIARSQRYFGNPTHRLLEQLENTASRPMISDGTLGWAISNLVTLPPPNRRQRMEFPDDDPDNVLFPETMVDQASAALEIAGYRRGVHSWQRPERYGPGLVYSWHSLTLAALDRDREALELGARAIGLLRAAPNAREELTGALHRQALIQRTLGRYDQAADLLAEEVELLGAIPERRDALLIAVEQLIDASGRTGQVQRARRYAERQIELLEPAGSISESDEAAEYARALGRYAQIIVESDGALAEAETACARAEAVLADLPEDRFDDLHWIRAMVLGAKASVRFRTGDRRGSAAAYREAIRVRLASFDPGGQLARFASASANLGDVLFRTGRPVEAVGPLVQAKSLARRVGDASLIAACENLISFARATDPAGVDAELNRMSRDEGRSGI